MCWKDAIVTSRAPTQERLPKNVHDGDAEVICDIESRCSIKDLTEFENTRSVKKKRRWEIGSGFGKEFWTVELNLSVGVRMRELQFDIKFADQIIGARSIPVNFIFGRSLSDAEANEDDGGGSGSGELLPEKNVLSQPPLIVK